MNKQYILSIDQGTTGTTAVLIDNQGQWIGSAEKDFEQIFPQPGWVEHNPEAIWESVVYSIKKLISETKVDPKSIVTLGLTNQRETTVAWDSHTGKPIYNAIVWQCRRTTEVCRKLNTNKATVKLVKKKTGLVIDPYFSATKISWILKNVPVAKTLLKQNRLRVGTIDTFLLWRLTGGESFKTEVSNASRTMLMNLSTLKWDKDLLKLFKISESILPEIKESAHNFGTTKDLDFIPNGIPICGILGDQQAALFGQACYSAGNAKCTFGTGSFILLNTGEKLIYSKHGMLTTVGWKLNGKTTYALEGGAFSCGAAVQWLRDGLGIIRNSKEIESLALSVSTTEGVEFIPALSGLGAPYWKPKARGTLLGLTRGTTRAHIARATLESLALQNFDILTAMEKDSGKNIKILSVDGGASENNLLMQFQSDFMNRKVLRPKIIETTSYGAALMAGLGFGLWKKTSDIISLHQKDREFQPSLNNRERLNRIDSWHKAIQKSY